MNQWREKSPIALEEEILKKAKTIFEDFKDFTDGQRVMFLIQRHKEGGETNNSKLIKKLPRNSDEWFKVLKELLKEQMTSDLPLRIYACVNNRDFNKAIRKFKYEQLDADYYDQVQKENFYLDVKNRFIGCLMQPAQRASSNFLFDIDNLEGVDVLGEMLKTIPEEHIIKTYKTKNGWHMVTKPFNYTTCSLPSSVELKKDGLLLLSF